MYLNIDKKTLVPALIGAGLCLFFQRSGFFAFFFLVPLGFLAYRYDYRTSWLALLAAVTGNALLTGVLSAKLNNPAGEVVWDILFFTVMAFIFTGITAAPPGLAAKVSTTARFVAGSCLGAVLFAGIYFRILASPAFSEYVNSTINSLVSLYRSPGPDVVQNALLESLTAETVLELMKTVMLRGGSLITCTLLFFISRQASLALARLTRRERVPNALIAFHVKPAVIWVLSVSLLLVVITVMMKLEIPEIILWNILILCGILYFAQGCGILQFFLARMMSPFMRFFLLVLLVILLFSPGINAVFLGGVALLGIAENWVPFRAPKPNGPPSTPEAGDDGN